MENSKTYQYRKVMKPMLERKRRARINKCLDNLKDLMVECLTEEGEHIVRLEKADILELTVDYLRKQQQKRKQNFDNISSESFRNGYIYAANEVSKALASIPGVNITLGTTLMTHLGHHLNQIQPIIASTLNYQTKSINFMSPLKIDLENEIINNRCNTSCSSNNNSSNSNYSYNSNGSLLSQISPASSGYHSDLESPVSSENSFSSVWRPW